MNQEHSLTFGPFRLETTSGCLWHQDAEVPLRPRSLAMLRYLAERPGRLVTKAEVIQQIWAGTHVSDDVLRASVRDIRRALGDDAAAPQYLETVGRQGYRFLQGGVDIPLQAVGPVVGRQGEVDRLQDRFGKAVSGERQFVLLSGEPGIGKTTVVNLFLDRIAEQDGVRVAHGQCIVHYGEGEAYQPMLEALGRLAREPGGPEVLSVLQRYAPMWLVQLPALVNSVELERLQRQVQGATQARMMRELCEALEALTTETPLILVFEDLHWSDVSTVELLGAIAQRRESARLFVLGTYRPVDATVHAHALRHVVQELRGRGQCEELAMELLSPEDVTAYVTGRLGGPVSATLNRLISWRSEGNPLFVVNLIDHLLQQKALIQPDDQWVVNPERQELVATIPEGLRPLIMRRLEALSSEVYRALEVASVAGIEYDTAAVAAALQQDVDDVEAVYESLATKGHFIEGRELSEWPDGTLSGRYRFQHALYHQVLYEQVGSARRAQVHLRLGNRLEAGYEDRAHEIAVELAIHFEQGRDVRRAVQYLQAAGNSAQKRSAHVEAIGHFTTGLELLHVLPDATERWQHELTLQLSLGGALHITKGQAAPELEHAYRRARALCEQLGNTPQLFPVLFGLFRFYDGRAQLQTARALGEQLLAVARQTQDPRFLMMAHFVLGRTHVILGGFAVARTHLEESLAHFDSEQDYVPVAGITNQDPRVAAQAHEAVALWFLGYPEQALVRMRAALSLAQTLGDPFRLTYALTWNAVLHLFRREGHATQRRAEEAIALADEQGFAWSSAQARFCRGWALREQGLGAEGVVEIRQSLSAWRATGAEVGVSLVLAQLAQAYGQMGQAEEGLAVLSEAQASMNKTEERWWEVELHRLQGELLLSLSLDKHAEAEACFHQALHIARHQQAKSWELRASTSLSRLWQSQGKRQDAYDLLISVYEWFNEGFDTADLMEAKVLLQICSKES